MWSHPVPQPAVTPTSTTPVDSWPIPWRFDMNFPTLRPGKSGGSWLDLLRAARKKSWRFSQDFKTAAFFTPTFFQPTCFCQNCRKSPKQVGKNWEKSQDLLENCPGKSLLWRERSSPCRKAQNKTSLCGLLRTSVDCWLLLRLHLARAKKSTKEAWKAIEKFHHDITWIYTKLHHLGTLYSTSKCLHLYITPKNIKKILPDSNYPFNQINQTNLRGITPATSVV